MKTRKFTGRIASLVAIVLLMLTILTGCATTAAPTLNIDSEAFKVEGEDGMAVVNTKLEDAAKMMAVAYSGGYNVRELLVAANRGYDITGGTDAAKDYSEDLGCNVAAAQKVIQVANQKAVDAGSDKALSNDKLDSVVKNLTKEDVALLLKSFRETVNKQENDIWGAIMGGIGWFLSLLTNTVGFGSYIVGICVFAIIIEIVMIPFAIKQQKNSIKQAKLRPKEMAIRNKYKGRNDQPTMQKMQAEIQELYQRENFSPYSGCLPLLIQLPIIMVLYNIVMDPIHYVLGQSANVSAALSTFATASPAAGGLGLSLNSANGTIELLSKISSSGLDRFGDFQYFNFGEGVLDSLETAFTNIPNFNIGSINFGLAPMANGFADWTSWVLMIVPVVTFASYFATSKLGRKFMYQPGVGSQAENQQMACSNNMMDITMPAMSTFFTLALPSVIGVYWAFRSWLGFAKTVIMAKVMPLPTFTEEDYKAAVKEMAGKKTVKKSERAGTVRSLHYIDDEDFEDTRERGIARREAIEAREREEAERKAANAKPGRAAAPLKDENRHEDANTAEEKTEETSQEAPRDNNDNN